MSGSAVDLPGIDATPAEGQRIKHNGVIYTTVKEGLAHILVPEQKDAKESETVQQVFYNPIQQFNRDMTILAMKAYGKEKMQEKEAASKARSGRFAEKKRKRKEQAQSEERPAKSPKLLDGASAVEETAPVLTSAATDTEMPDATTDSEPANPERQQSVQGETGVPAVKEKPLPFTILDALSASGLRALRYAHEIPFLTKVTANDLLKVATESIERNAIHNKLTEKINISHDNAMAHMYQIIINDLRKADMVGGRLGKSHASDKYDVVDLDPYGTAAPFLDAAVQAVRDDGGLLCVTCTDSSVWASNGYPEKCYSLYGGVPVKGWYSHEVGLRLALYSIQTAAAKYGLAIEPLLSLSIDFYLRVFVRVTKSPAMVKFQGGKNMVVYACSGGCGSWTTQLLMKNKPAPNKKGSGIFYKHGVAKAPTTPEQCEHCGSTLHLAGPMYGGRIHSPDFVQKVIDEANDAPPEIYGTKERIRGMLQTALEEFLPTPEEQEAAKSKESADKRKLVKKKMTEVELAAFDPYPFYFHPAQVSGVIHCKSPPEAPLKGALRGLGYRVTRSHCKAGSMKTDAPWSIIWHVFREWVRQKAPVTEANIKPGSVAYRILKLGEKKGTTVENTEATEEQPAVNGTVNGKKAAVALPEVVFDEQLGRDISETKFVRYQENPRENWGPMNRARGK